MAGESAPCPRGPRADRGAGRHVGKADHRRVLGPSSAWISAHILTRRRPTTRRMAARNRAHTTRRRSMVDASRRCHQGVEPVNRMADELSAPRVELRNELPATRPGCVGNNHRATRRRRARICGSDAPGCRSRRARAIEPAPILDRSRPRRTSTAARLHEPVFHPRLLPRCCHPGLRSIDRARRRVPVEAPPQPRRDPGRRDCRRRAARLECPRTRSQLLAPGLRRRPGSRRTSRLHARSLRTRNRTIASVSSGSTGRPRSSTTRIGGGTWSPRETGTRRSTPFTQTGIGSFSWRTRPRRISYPSHVGVGSGRSVPHSYAIADDADGLGGSKFVGTDEPLPVASPGRTLATGIRVACGRPTRLPSGHRGTQLRISDPSPGDRIGVSDELAPLPTRRTIFIGSGLSKNGWLTLTCSGRPALVLDVLDSPLPTNS